MSTSLFTAPVAPDPQKSTTSSSVAPTARAVELFNRMAASGRVFAALHLTC